MNKKISELLETIELNDEDILMILQSGQNKKIKAMNIFKKINLVKVGPTEPNPKADVWLKKGKNLLNLLDCIFLPGYSTASIVEKSNNEITLKGTASTYQYVDLRFTLEAGTYTIQRKWELKSGTGNDYTGAIIISDVTTSSAKELGTISKSENFKTFTIDHDAQIRLYLYLSREVALPNETQVRFYDMQIIKGSSEEEFEEYVEPKVYVKNNNNEYILFKENEEKNAIHTYLSSVKSITTDSNQRQTVPLDSILAKKGNGFDLKDNAIAINKEDIKVKVTAKINCDRTGESGSRNYGLIIQKNSYSLTYQNLQILQNANYEEIICEAILDVTIGDKIYLDLRSVASTGVNTKINGGRCATYLMVEEL